jgi:hypothetical protein
LVVSSLWGGSGQRGWYAHAPTSSSVNRIATNSLQCHTCEFHFTWRSVHFSFHTWLKNPLP